ncbi:MAG: SDR family NAD(P)-dependent oxidoreductase [Sneathiella sp.]|nr:SDR family NAD(P)-dependent oxidoreductase [Sneathiella sp.]
MSRFDVAIVGLSCRFPGAKNADDYWRLLREGKDTVTAIPENRWDKESFYHPGKEVAGKAYTFSAGVLDDITGFDAQFFGISPREAEQMDPQQRLLLEVTWEALEDAGQIPSELSGKNCAVMIGISGTDYGSVRQGDPAGGNAYFMLGSTLSIAANRISYIFDFKGPSMAIDTACSSSLVAFNEALNALWSGRAEMAVTGGVNLLMSPFPFVGFSGASMLSEDGLCKAFSKNADGYVRSEGCGVLVLKPLSDALRDKDTIHAVVSGAGVNSDGKTNGIAMPSCASQQNLLEAVIEQFGINPAEIDYFEAHGTGTSVGDPIEALALGRAIGQRRGENSSPLLIGSAKSNIGHLEPASGMAGLIKAVLIIKNRAIPPTLHCEELNPNIDFETLNLSPVRNLRKLADKKRPLQVGVNSFGFGGTNAAVFLREHCVKNISEQKVIQERLAPLVISARSEEALRSRAGQLAGFLTSKHETQFYDTAYTSAFRRELHDHRAIVWGDCVTSVAEKLQSFSSGQEVDICAGKASSNKPKIGFVFSGNGAQWPGMGRVLYENNLRFRESVNAVDQLLIEMAGWSVAEVLFSEDCKDRLSLTEIAQPALFAIQVGICRCLEALGIRPDAVTGHSVGEVASAYIAGIFDLREAVRLILCRSDAQGRVRGMGKMAALSYPPEALENIINRFGNRFELAAVNSPTAFTLSGEEAALMELAAEFKNSSTLVKVLDLEYAFHSRVLEQVKDGFIESVGTLARQDGTLSFYSTVSGSLMDGLQLDQNYWWLNARQPVQFQQAVEAMAADGVSIFIEIGPHAVLQSYLRQNLKQSNVEVTILPSLTRTKQGNEALEEIADLVFVSGGFRDFGRWFPTEGKQLSLPHYPWQKEALWFKKTSEAEGAFFRENEGIFLGARPLAKQTIWENQIDAERFPFLKDHRVGGSVIFPATGFIEIILEASRALFDGDFHEIENFEIRRPLLLDPGISAMVRFVYDPDDKAFRVETRRYLSDTPWTVNAVGRLAEASFPACPIEPLSDAAAFSDWFSAEEHYALTKSLGLDYGPAFQCLVDLESDGEAGLMRLREPERFDGDTGFVVHPATFDACLQGLLAIGARSSQSLDETVYLPYQLKRLKVFKPGAVIEYCNVRLERQGARSLVASFALYDAEKRPVAVANGFRFLRADSLKSTRKDTRVYRFENAPLTSIQKKDVVPNAEQIASFLELDNGADLDLNRLTRLFAHEQFSAFATEEKDIFSGWKEHLFSRLCIVDFDDETVNARALWKNYLQKHPEAVAELLCIGSAGKHLAEVLTGEKCAFKPTRALMEHLLQDSPYFHNIRDVVLEAMKRIALLWPLGRRLRILDLSVRSNFSQPFLAEMGGLDIDYTVVSPDEEAIARLQTGSSNLSNLRALTIDFSGVLTTEELGELGVFDVVVCGQASLDAGMTAALLSNLTKISAPQALLMVSEVKPQPWLDLVFGCEENWWSHDGQPAPKEGNALKQLFASEKFQNIQFLENDDMQLVLCDAPDEGANALEVTLRAQEGEELWLLVASKSEIAAEFISQVSRQMETQGKFVVIAWNDVDALVDEENLSFDASDQAAWLDLLSMLVESASPPTGVIYFADLGDDGWSVTQAAAALTKIGLKDTPSLQLVVFDATGNDLGQAREELLTATSWGAARVIRNEFPGLNCRSLEVCFNGASIADLINPAIEALFQTTEPELLLSAEGLSAARLIEMENLEPVDTLASGSTLVFTPGKLDTLQWKPTLIPVPTMKQIVVETRATGLNFRDLMFTLGALPEEALENGFSGPTIGLEASGVVSAVGEDVVNFAVGDEVICYAPACFSTHIVSDENATMKKPAMLSFEQAATIPTVFMTVYYALHHLAGMEAGERLLIHGAAGGVGLAAIQYAQHVGAEIYVTVGSNEKRNMMRLLGIREDHILNSRTLQFGNDIMKLTNGEGIDIVLNSLAGEAIHRSLDILRPLGRFLELGKRDYYENSRIGLKFFRNNLSYFGVDLDQLMAERPARCQRLFGELIDLFELGILTPLPFRTFDSNQVAESFRHLQKSQHVGKIIVKPPVWIKPESLSRNCESLILRSDGAYLVTGGTSGFGLKTAEWLATKGAGALILISRSGLSSEQACKSVEALEAQGVTVYTKACDVTDIAVLEALVSEVEAEGFSLKGVVHAAAVFEDGLIETLDRQQYRNVLSPKVEGGWALHHISLRRELDFFVLYSSITTAFGNPGQANYVAANSYLEALARHRNSSGLPALAVGWGPISDAGYLARNEDVKVSLQAKLGRDILTSQEALNYLERLLLFGEEANVYIAGVNWEQLRAGLPILRSPVYCHVMSGEAVESEEGVEDVLEKILEMDDIEALDFISNLIIKEIGKVLGLMPDKVDHNKSMFDLGMDSLMALELSHGIEKRFRIEVPPISLSESSSVSDLVRRIYHHLLGDDERSSEVEQYSALAEKHLGSVETTAEDVLNITKKIA